MKGTYTNYPNNVLKKTLRLFPGSIKYYRYKINHFSNITNPQKR